MTDNSTMAMGALWSQRLNRAFKAVEYVLFTSDANREAFVVVIATNFATGHASSPTIADLDVTEGRAVCSGRSELRWINTNP